MGDHRDRRALVVELLEQGEDRGPGGAVEVAGRLVGEHDRGPPDQRTRDRDPLPLTARELVRSCLEPVAEPDRGEHLGRGQTPLGDGTPA